MAAGKGLFLQSRTVFAEGMKSQWDPCAGAVGLPNICELLLEEGITPVRVFSSKIIHLLLILLFWGVNKENLSS